MKKLYVVIPLVGAAAFAALFYYSAAPNPWRTWDLTKDRDNRCSVHQKEMERRKIHVSHGSGAAERWLVQHMQEGEDTSSFFAAEKREFPHGRSVVFSGGPISYESPKYAYI